VLHRLRVRNIADGVVVFGKLHPEFLLSADPEIIVVTGQSWADSENLRLGYAASLEPALRRISEFQNRPGWKSLRAVKNRRIYAVFHTFTIHFFGFAGIEALAKDFYPELFPDIHPEKDFQEFHDRFMPIPLRGVWMLPPETSSI
jgi:iron complex transport system substrate-binding protein